MKPTYNPTPFTLKLNPANLSSPDFGFTGFVYVSKANYDALLRANESVKPVQVAVKNYIFNVEADKNLDDNSIGVGKYTRLYLKVAFTDSLPVTLFQKKIDVEYRLSFVQVEIALGANVTGKRIEVEQKDVEKSMRKGYANQFIGEGQTLLLEYGGNILVLKIQNTQRIDIGVKNVPTQGLPGILSEETQIEWKFEAKDDFLLKGSNAPGQGANLFRSDFKFEDLGVGGLDKELFDIFRRAFATRRFPPSVLASYGIKHVKGLLLYGPPGTGKTLIAVKLAQALNATKPKVVCGPELFDKYVGETERKIKELFAEAMADEKKLGDQSPLHIIIFDEFDAIAKKRGTVQSNAGVGDSAVNMLLSMIDGPNKLNNILVIAMTNRKDMIDDAILRPGRFEIHVEVSLPNEEGRVQILKIHTANMQKNNLLGPDVSLEKLAKVTKNFTGAEIESLTISAATHCFGREFNLMDFSKPIVMKEGIKLQHQDFLRALEEVKPQFGIDSDKFDALLKGKIVDFGTRFKKNKDIVLNLVNQLKFSKTTQLISCLFEGENGSGKSAFASWAALESDFPFVKLISSENFVGFHETGKIDAIVKVFNDAYRSPISLIVLDDIERLIEYVSFGPRFSNALLQALMVLVKKLPTKETSKLMIIGTTSNKQVLKDLELYHCFDVIVHMPTLSQDEIFTVLRQENKGDEKEFKKIADTVGSMTMKKLLMMIDMATQGEDYLTYNRFVQCYEECGKDDY